MIHGFFHLKFNFYKHFEPDDYLKIINGSACLIGNSSSGIRESSYLGVPVVNIGDRQKGKIQSKNIINCSYDTNEIYRSIKKAISVKFSKKIKNIVIKSISVSKYIYTQYIINFFIVLIMAIYIILTYILYKI